MANIVSATYSATAETDGRRWVAETYTDVVGLTHQIVYLAAADADLGAAMAAHAAQFGLDLASAEIAANVGQVLGQGATAALTFNYGPIEQTIAAGLAAFPNATPTQAIVLGDWLQAQTADNLGTWFGLTADQIAAVQALPTLASQVEALGVLVAQVSS